MSRIVVAEDNVEVRGMLCRTLRAEGFEVFEAEDGVDALRAVQSGAVDLLLCDLFMPTMDGLELIDRLRREGPAIAIVAMSGGGQWQAMDLLPMACCLGAREGLHKPVLPSLLLECVHRTLEAAGRSASP